MIEKPWGYEKILYQDDNAVVKLLHVEPNSRLSLQYHKYKTETMFLVSGRGFLTLCGNDWDMVIQRPYQILPGAIHRLYTEDEPCDVIEVSSTELDDVIRLEDDYNRETK